MLVMRSLLCFYMAHCKNLVTVVFIGQLCVKGRNSAQW
jgi:hypothetical protein